MPRRIDPRWYISGITVLGAVLRVFRLDYQSLWVDEVVTFLGARGPILDIVSIEEVRGSEWLPTVHSLYYLVVHLAMNIGDDEFVLRLPSVVAGILSVPLVYAIARRWFGTAAGLASGFLLAISPLHLYFSQEARPYALMVFLALVSVYSLQRLLPDPKRPGWRLCFIVSTAATLYCQPVALPFIGVTIFYAFMAAPRTDRIDWALNFAGVALLCFPEAYALVALPPVKSPTAPSSESPSPYHVVYAVWAFAAGFSVGPSVRELHAPDRLQIALRNIWIIAPILLFNLALFSAGTVRAWRASRLKCVVIAVWFLLPILFLMLGAVATRHPFNVRYVILSFPPFIVLLGLGAISVRGRWLRAAAWGSLLLVSIGALANYYFNPRYHREDNRKVIRTLARQASPGDLVLVSVPYSQIMFNYYDPGPVRVVAYPFGEGKVDSTRLPADFDRLTAGEERFWVLLSRTFHSDPKGRLLSYLDRRFPRERAISGAGTQLILYTVPEVPTAREGPSAR